MWTKDTDDQAFLGELAYAIIASVAPSELNDFNALMSHYFANPNPPRVRHHRTPAYTIQLTPVTPAVITAVLNLLLMEIQEAAQYDQSDIVKLGLKRLLRQRGAHPNERIALRSANKLQAKALDVIVYLYTRPVAIRVPLDQIIEVAYEAAHIYGLDEAQADELVPIIITRLSLGPNAIQNRENE